MRAIIIVLACAAGVSGQAVYPLGDLESDPVTRQLTWYPFRPGPLAKHERVYATVTDQEEGEPSGFSLIATDGTRAGTRMIVDWTGREALAAPPGVRVGGRRVFPAMWLDKPRGRFTRVAPGATDGTSTWEMVSEIGEPIDAHGEIMALGDRVAFFAGDPGAQLWVSRRDLRRARPLFDRLCPPSPGCGGSTILLEVSGARLLYVGLGKRSDGAVRNGLWSTDGTEAGTSLLREVLWPTAWSLARSGGYTLIALGREVIRTDGTAVGTSAFTFPDGAPTLASVDGEALALVGHWVGRGRVYRTDGTPRGTQLAVELPAPPRVDARRPVAVVHGAAYFVLTTFQHGSAVWRTDGTAAGTRMAFDPVPGGSGSEPELLTAAGDTLFFVAEDRVWAFDGDRGVGVTPPQRAGVSSSVFEPLGDRLVFLASDQGVHGLWSSDGTLAGTAPLYEVRSKAATAASWPRPYAAADRGYLDVRVGGESRVWQTDGTVAGTREADFALGRPLLRWNSTMYGLHDDGVHGLELWRSDGTKAGSVLLADACPGSRGQWDGTAMRVFDGALYALLDDGVHGAELWRSDGTPAGTAMVADLIPGPVGAGGPFTALLEASPRLVIAGTGAVWESDGTAAGTRFVTSTIRSLPAYWTPPTPGVLGERVIGVAYDEHAASWWAHAPGATAVTELVRADPFCSTPVVLGDAALFTSGRALFRTDGTPAGTVVLRVLDGAWSSGAGPGAGGVAAGIVLGHCVLLVGDDASHGRELWCTDGTVAGTRLLRDIEPGPGGSQPMALTRFRDGALFTAATSRHGRELWFTDGTERGTRLVADVHPGPATGCSEIVRPLVQGSRHALVFAADAERGAEPWATDGSRMWLLRDVRPGPASSAGGVWPALATSVHGLVVTPLNDGVHGREPWAIDPGATARSIEPGCDRRVSGLQLELEDPVLGARVAVEVDGLGGRLGVVIVGPPAPLSSTPGPCTGIVDLTSPFAAQLLPLGAKAWRGHWRVPRDPALDGLRLVAQTFVLDGAELGVSNPVLLRLGR